MCNRLCGRPGAKRPGALVGDNGKNSWGPSWGFGRVLASSLLTSPPLPLASAHPCSPRTPAWNPGLAVASAPTLSSAQLATAEAVHKAWTSFESSQGASSCSCALPPSSGQLHLPLPRSSCPTLSLCTNNSKIRTVITTKVPAMSCMLDTDLFVSHFLQRRKLKHWPVR